MVYVGGDAEHAALTGKTEFVGEFREVTYKRKHFSDSYIQKNI